MNPIHNILVIVDPTANVHPAIAKGAILAEKFAARLDLFVCDTQASRSTRPRDQLGPWLDSLAKPLRDKGIEVMTEVLAADPLHTALLDRVKRTCADQGPEFRGAAGLVTPCLTTQLVSISDR